MTQDILSDVLRRLRLRGVLYFYVSGARDWAAEAPPSCEIAAAVMPGAEHVMEFHVVVSGTCWAAVIGEAPVRLEAGDIVVFPHGDPHVVSSSAGMRTPPDPAGYFARREQRAPFMLHLDAHEVQVGAVVEEPGNTTLVCGFLGCDLRPFNPLIASLPRLMHVREGSKHDWTAQLMRQAALESKARRDGGDAMLERLSEMMFIDAVRRYLSTIPDDGRGWLAGIRDRFVGRALALMHDAPATAWSVDELGRRVGLSRSALHERFADMVGQPPMQYLANWRMQVAAALLRDTAATVASVAQEVGYESEAAFARAFKRAVGQSPSLWRRRTNP